MLCQQVNNAWQGNNDNWNNNNNGGSNNNNRSNNGGSRRNNRGRNNNNNSRNGKRNGGSDGDRPWNVRQFEGATYCWSHGHDTGPHNTSAMCTNRAQGHQAAATSTNTMGGNPKNAERTMYPSQVGRVGRAPSKAFVQQQTQQWAAATMAQQPTFQQASQPMFQQAIQPMYLPMIQP